MRQGLLFALLVGLSGCLGLSTRFDQNVTTSFAHQPMRKLETDALELYYPAQHREEAMRVAARLNACVTQLKALPRSGTKRPKLVVYLTSAEFNNAYVQPQTLGYPQQMVLAHHMTLELFNWFELGQSEIGDISCHESVHYIQMLETNGFWRVMNLITGGLFQTNTFTESWFLEGLATHYEGRLGKDTGRPSSPIWNGMFAAGVAARGGHLNPGDLSPENRDELPFGGNYLVGMQFVDYLARTYGEQKLWELIDFQGGSFFSPLGVTLRFKHIYGKSIGALFDDFSAELRQNLRVRTRPSDQQVLLSQLGYFARVAASPSDGAVAALTAERDEVVRLVVREKDGTLRYRRRVTPTHPGRRYIGMHPENVSGMSFTGDGRFLYLVNLDTGIDTEDSARLFQIDARTGDVGKIWELKNGMGGGVSPDGTRYVYSEVIGDTSNLVELNLVTGKRTKLTHFTGRSSLGAASYDPAGARIVFSRFTGEGFDLFLRNAEGTLEQLTADGRFNYGAHFADANRVIFMREVDGRAQAHSLDLTSRQLLQITNAPYIAFDPVPLGPDSLVMVNRDGWSWSLDRAPIPNGGLPLPAVARAPTLGSPTDDGPTPLGVDQPYTPGEHFFYPELRAPWGYGFQSARGWTGIFGVSATGSDRLGLHNWSIDLSYQLENRGPSFNVGYANFQLAPWLLYAAVNRNEVPGIVDWGANIGMQRTFWTTPLNFGVTALQREEAGLNGAVSRARMIAPSVSSSFSATESTPYAGVRRGLVLSGSASFYSHVYGSDFDFADLRGEIDGYIPLPGLLRQSFLLFARGHALAGLPSNLKLLTVGGIGRGYYEFQNTNQTADAGPNVFLPGIAFSESLRGYEDHAIHATRAAIGGARWRYPILFDKGTASTLYIFPSLFLRQLDFDAFAEGARTDSEGSLWHRAVGASASLRLTIGQALPITIFYQYAYRFDDHLPMLHLVGFALQ